MAKSHKNEAVIDAPIYRIGYSKRYTSPSRPRHQSGLNQSSHIYAISIPSYGATTKTVEFIRSTSTGLDDKACPITTDGCSNKLLILLCSRSQNDMGDMTQAIVQVEVT